MYLQEREQGAMAENAVKSLARVGLTAKGIVYCLMGTLTLMSALHFGGGDADKDEVFLVIFRQPFGKGLLVILVLGLIAYVGWRFCQAFIDSERKGKDKKGVLARAAYAFSGLIYCGITYSAIRLLLNDGSGSGSTQQNVAEMFNTPIGKWLVIFLGVFVIARGIFQLYIAYSGKLEKKLNDGAIGAKVKRWAVNAGKLGYTCRGLVLGIIGYFLVAAGMHVNPGEATDTKGSFRIIESSNSYGQLLLCFVAGGLILYGLFMFIEARHRHIKSG